MPTVKMSHPDDPDVSIEVESERVPLFKASAWVEDNPKAAKPKAAKKASTK